MKYQVLVADDEAIIIKGIEKILSTHRNDFEVSASAGDGDEALNLLQSQNFDVLITDIRMPGIDGLELIEKARTLFPDLIIVILSGYEEMVYYKKAIREGSFAYILKPLDIKEFLSVMDRITLSLSHLKDALVLQKTQWLNSLILPGLNKQLPDAKNFRKYGIKLIVNRLFVMMIHIDNEIILANEISPGDNHLLQENIIAFATGFFSRRNAVFFKCGAGIIGIMNYSDCFEVELEDIKAHCREFIDSVFSELFASLSLGLGKPCHDPGGLPDSYNSALAASTLKIYSGHKSLNLYADYSGLKDQLIDLKNEKKEILASIERLDYPRLKKVLDRIALEVSAIRPEIKEVERTYYHILITMHEGFQKIYDPKNYLDFKELFSIEKIKITETLVEMNDWVSNLGEKIIHTATGATHSNSPMAIRTAVEYIKDNYNKNISLGDAARKAYMHPVYFSKQFKHVLGISFSEYLNDIRMEKAKTYLKQLEYKIRDIAGMLGFADEKHFYKVFKKQVGMTPNEYRNKMP